MLAAVGQVCNFFIVARLTEGFHTKVGEGQSKRHIFCTKVVPDGPIVIRGGDVLPCTGPFSRKTVMRPDKSIFRSSSQQKANNFGECIKLTASFASRTNLEPA